MQEARSTRPLTIQSERPAKIEAFLQGIPKLLARHTTIDPCALAFASSGLKGSLWYVYATNYETIFTAFAGILVRKSLASTTWMLEGSTAELRTGVSVIERISKSLPHRLLSPLWSCKADVGMNTRASLGPGGFLAVKAASRQDEWSGSH